MITNKKSFVVACSILLLAPGIRADDKKPATKKFNETAKKAVQGDVRSNIAFDDVATVEGVKLETRYVNTMEAMQKSKMGAEVSAKIEKKRTDLAAEIKGKEEALQLAMTEFQSKGSMLSKSARNEEEAKLMKMRRELEGFGKSCEDELKLAMQQETEALSQQVEKDVTKIAVTDGYDVVVDVYTGRTIYASNKAMITTDLVKEMDASYKVANNTKTKDVKKVTA